MPPTAAEPGATAAGCLDLPPPPRPPYLPLKLVAAVALVDGEGRVLICQRPAGKPMAGWWEFPGGKIDDGETPEAAVVRELKEELGIDLSESCLAALTFASYSYPDFHLLMPLFVARVWRGQPSPREGQGLRWIFPRDLARLETLLPADKPMIWVLRDLLQEAGRCACSSPTQPPSPRARGERKPAAAPVSASSACGRSRANGPGEGARRTPLVRSPSSTAPLTRRDRTGRAAGGRFPSRCGR